MSNTIHVNGFMFSPDGDFVVLIRKDHPQWQKGLWNGMGGRCQYGEPPSHAMAREFEEEAGVNAPHYQWERFCILCFNACMVIFYRTFHGRYDSVVTAEQEHVTIHAVNELPHDLVPNLRWLVPLAQDRTLATPTVVLDRWYGKPHNASLDEELNL